MELFELYRGKSKKRLHLVMVDSLKKVTNYRDAIKTGYPKTVWFDIRPAPKGSVVWRKDATNKWTGYNDSGPKIVK